MKMSWRDSIEGQGFVLIPAVFTDAQMDRMLDDGTPFTTHSLAPCLATSRTSGLCGGGLKAIL